MKRLNRFVSGVVMVLAVFVLLAGCSKKSSDDSPPPAPPDTSTGNIHLSGTAAVGMPIGSATITLKDKSGAVVTAVTGTDGKYTLEATGVTAPFLLKVVSGSANLYSVATATSGTVKSISTPSPT